MVVVVYPGLYLCGNDGFFGIGESAVLHIAALFALIRAFWWKGLWDVVVEIPLISISLYNFEKFHGIYRVNLV